MTIGGMRRGMQCAQLILGFLVVLLGSGMGHLGPYLMNLRNEGFPSTRGRGARNITQFRNLAVPPKDARFRSASAPRCYRTRIGGVKAPIPMAKWTAVTHHRSYRKGARGGICLGASLLPLFLLFFGDAFSKWVHLFSCFLGD